MGVTVDCVTRAYIYLCSCSLFLRTQWSLVLVTQLYRVQEPIDPAVISPSTPRACASLPSPCPSSSRKQPMSATLREQLRKTRFSFNSCYSALRSDLQSDFVNEDLSKQGLSEERAKLENKKLSLTQLIDHCGLDDKLLHYNRNEEEFMGV
ncbi:unnamed protein product [Nyctereutes procyonoides]|uniref:Swi5-dependent recombination DNA repair protein 1 homolog n=1 Tax=Nyctereutes procyonoides TaxID=34880 RepID=A0A811YYV0_NYCPR|nr:unnamed protein product [Nyctereutes procyonoides]